METIKLDGLVDLIKSIKPETSSDENCFSPQDIAEHLGVSSDRATRILGDLKRRGKIEVVRVKYERLDGVVTTVPRYKLVN